MDANIIIALWVWWVLLFFPIRSANRHLTAMGVSLGFWQTVMLYITLTIAIPRFYYLWVKEVIDGNKK
jgi:hypothetical protein